MTSADGLIIATKLTSDTTDFGRFAPMSAKAEAAANLITAHQPPSAGGQASQPGKIRLVLADADYLSLHNLTSSGPRGLIAAGRHRNRPHHWPRARRLPFTLPHELAAGQRPRLRELVEAA